MMMDAKKRRPETGKNAGYRIYDTGYWMLDVSS
jgi:hypothetical protein